MYMYYVCTVQLHTLLNDSRVFPGSSWLNKMAYLKFRNLIYVYIVYTIYNMEPPPKKDYINAKLQINKISIV